MIVPQAIFTVCDVGGADVTFCLRVLELHFVFFRLAIDGCLEDRQVCIILALVLRIDARGLPLKPRGSGMFAALHCVSRDRAVTTD